MSAVIKDYQPTKPSTFLGGKDTDGLVLTAGDPREDITYSSDFIKFKPNSKDSFSLSFTLEDEVEDGNTGGGLSIDENGYLSSFIASELGTFSSTQTPTLSVPEPGTFAMLLAGLVLIGVTLHRKIS